MIIGQMSDKPRGTKPRGAGRTLQRICNLWGFYWTPSCAAVETPGEQWHEVAGFGSKRLHCINAVPWFDGHMGDSAEPRQESPLPVFASNRKFRSLNGVRCWPSCTDSQWRRTRQLSTLEAFDDDHRTAAVRTEISGRHRIGFIG